MKKLLWIILPVIIIGLLFCFFATLNIYTGSSSSFFLSAFEDVQSEWECKKYNLRATVIEHPECELVRIEDHNSGETYLLMALGDFLGELYYLPKDMVIPKRVQALDEMLGERLYLAKIKHKRWFKTVYAFEIIGADKDCWYKSGTSTIRFRRVNN